MVNDSDFFSNTNSVSIVFIQRQKVTNKSYNLPVESRLEGNRKITISIVFSSSVKSVLLFFLRQKFKINHTVYDLKPVLRYFFKCMERFYTTVWGQKKPAKVNECSSVGSYRTAMIFFLQSSQHLYVFFDGNFFCQEFV